MCFQALGVDRRKKWRRYIRTPLPCPYDALMSFWVLVILVFAVRRLVGAGEVRLDLELSEERVAPRGTGWAVAASAGTSGGGCARGPGPAPRLSGEVPRVKPWRAGRRGVRESRLGARRSGIGVPRPVRCRPTMRDPVRPVSVRPVSVRPVSVRCAGRAVGPPG